MGGDHPDDVDREDVHLAGAGGEETVPLRQGYVFIISTAAALTAATLGYDVGVMADAMVRMEATFNMTDFEQEVVVSSLNFVAAVGALVAGGTADVLGRRGALGVCSVLYLVGTAIMTVANSYPVLLAGRVITGVGVGISFVVGPTYISEIAPPAIRGRLATIFDLSINVGILCGYLVGFAVEHALAEKSEGTRWRAMIGLGSVFPVLVAAALVVLPESPRWLVVRGREEEARCVLAKVLPAEDVSAAMKAMQGEHAMQATWTDVLCPSETHLKTTLGIAYGLALWQQITGSEAILYYSSTFLKNAGMTSEGMLLLGNILVGLAKLLPEFWVMASIDKRGRRWHLIFSAATMTAAIFALAGAFVLHMSPVVTVVLLCCFMATFSAGLGPFSFVTASELLPLSHRAKGMSVVTFLNRLASGAVSLTALTLSAQVGQGYYFLIYGFVSLASLAFYATRVRETAGKTLEEITDDMRQGPQMSLIRALCLC